MAETATKVKGLKSFGSAVLVELENGDEFPVPRARAEKLGITQGAEMFVVRGSTETQYFMGKVGRYR